MDIAMVERKVIEAWDKMLDFCPKCQHGLDQHEGYELMDEAVETLRALHYPDDAYAEAKARHDVQEDRLYLDDSVVGNGYDYQD